MERPSDGFFWNEGSGGRRSTHVRVLQKKDIHIIQFAICRCGGDVKMRNLNRHLSVGVANYALGWMDRLVGSIYLFIGDCKNAPTALVASVASSPAAEVCVCGAIRICMRD